MPVVTLLLRVSWFWTSVIAYLNPNSSYVNGLICKCLLFYEKCPITHVILSCIMVSFWQSQKLQLLADARQPCALGGECAVTLFELCNEGWLHFVSPRSKWSYQWAGHRQATRTALGQWKRVRVWWIHPLRSPGRLLFVPLAILLWGRLLWEVRQKALSCVKYQKTLLWSATCVFKKNIQSQCDNESPDLC